MLISALQRQSNSDQQEVSLLRWKWCLLSKSIDTRNTSSTKFTWRQLTRTSASIGGAQSLQVQRPLVQQCRHWKRIWDPPLPSRESKCKEPNQKLSSQVTQRTTNKDGMLYLLTTMQWVKQVYQSSLSLPQGPGCNALLLSMMVARYLRILIWSQSNQSKLTINRPFRPKKTKNPLSKMIQLSTSDQTR